MADEKAIEKDQETKALDGTGNDQISGEVLDKIAGGLTGDADAVVRRRP